MRTQLRPLDRWMRHSKRGHSGFEPASDRRCLTRAIGRFGYAQSELRAAARNGWRYRLRPIRLTGPSKPDGISGESAVNGSNVAWEILLAPG